MNTCSSTVSRQCKRKPALQEHLVFLPYGSIGWSGQSLNFSSIAKALSKISCIFWFHCVIKCLDLLVQGFFLRLLMLAYLHAVNGIPFAPLLDEEKKFQRTIAYHYFPLPRLTPKKTFQRARLQRTLRKNGSTVKCHCPTHKTSWIYPKNSLHLHCRGKYTTHCNFRFYNTW